MTCRGHVRAATWPVRRRASPPLPTKQTAPFWRCLFLRRRRKAPQLSASLSFMGGGAAPPPKLSPKVGEKWLFLPVLSCPWIHPGAAGLCDPVRAVHFPAGRHAASRRPRPVAAQPCDHRRRRRFLRSCRADLDPLRAPLRIHRKLK